MDSFFFGAKILNSLEQSPHETLAEAVILDFLYSNQPQQLEESVACTSRLQQLKNKDHQFWISLLQQVLLDSPYVCLIGKPSAALGEKLAHDEKERVQLQIEKLGCQGLEKLKEQLQRSVELNEMPVPPGLIQTLPIPEPNNIPLFELSTIRNGKLITSPLSSERGGVEKSSSLMIHMELDSPDTPIPLNIQFDGTQ